MSIHIYKYMKDSKLNVTVFEMKEELFKYWYLK